MSYSLQVGLPLENVCIRALACTAACATIHYQWNFNAKCMVRGSVCTLVIKPKPQPA